MGAAAKGKEICIAVTDNMLSAATGKSDASRYYPPEETSIICVKRYRERNTPYPSWYLFGSAEKSVRGLVKSYLDLGFCVSMCAESILALEGSFSASLVDVQFCTVRPELYQKLKLKGIELSGYLPECYSSKIKQVEEFSRNGGERYLPVQKFYRRGSEPILPAADAEVWIVKEPLGSAGTGASGRPYTVWLRRKLERTLPSLLKKLPSGSVFIAGEFVHTCDPYAGFADHVVHKMHYFAHRENNSYVVHPFGLGCQRFIHRCNRERLRTWEVLTLGEYIGAPKIELGWLENVWELGEFTRHLMFHGTGRVIFSVDFIIPADGRPLFLESNKLGATFAERFDPGLLPLIDAYPLFNV